MKLTFDFNCIISIENKENTASHLINLIELHNNGKISIYVPAISANEKITSGNYANNISGFKKRLMKLSKRPIEILAPMLYLGISFFDYSIFGNNEMENLDKEIHNTLFPNIPYYWADFVKLEGGNLNQLDPKWMNPRCDSISMWCHINYGNDIFVSNDNNFFKKVKYHKLIKLGAKEILKPIDAYKFLS